MAKFGLWHTLQRSVPTFMLQRWLWGSPDTLGSHHAKTWSSSAAVRPTQPLRIQTNPSFLFRFSFSCRGPADCDLTELHDIGFMRLPEDPLARFLADSVPGLVSLHAPPTWALHRTKVDNCPG